MSYLIVIVPYWLLSFVMWMLWRNRAHRLADALTDIEQGLSHPAHRARVALDEEWPSRAAARTKGTP